MASKKDITIAKKRVELLKGQEVKLKVNEGRNKIVSFDGTVTDMYDAIFTVQSSVDKKLYSYSYSDLITKIVRFYAK